MKDKVFKAINKALAIFKENDITLLDDAFGYVKSEHQGYTKYTIDAHGKSFQYELTFIDGILALYVGAKDEETTVRVALSKDYNKVFNVLEMLIQSENDLVDGVPLSSF